VTKLGTEFAEILTLLAAHRTEALMVALERAVTFGRWGPLTSGRSWPPRRRRRCRRT
jgi:hypothetical protein